MAEGAFLYCPQCATPLADETRYGKVRRICAACGYVRFSDPKVGVIALIAANQQVLLVRRGINPEKGKWALPGGYMDAGEMPEAALRRELREEVGLEVGPLRLLEIYPLVGAHEATLGIVLAFAGSSADGSNPAPEANDDVDAASWFAAAEIPADLAFSSTRQMLAAWAASVLKPEV